MLPIFFRDNEYARTYYRFLNVNITHTKHIITTTIEPSIVILDMHYRMDVELIQPIELVTELQRGYWFKIEHETS